MNESSMVRHIVAGLLLDPFRRRVCGAIPTPIMNILKYFGDEMKDDIVKEN